MKPSLSGQCHFQLLQDASHGMYVHAIIDSRRNSRKPAKMQQGLANSRRSRSFWDGFEVQQVLDNGAVVVLFRYVLPDPSNRFPSLPEA